MTKTTDFWVGDRFVRPSLGEIQLGPERVHIEPRSMEVLLALTRQPGEVFFKQELIDAVWGEAFVSDEVLTHAIWDLRRAFGDNASDPEFIQTIPKKGYRLIAPVKPVGKPRRRATDRHREPSKTAGGGGRHASRWRFALALVAVALLLWLGFRLGGERPPAGGDGTRTRQALLLAISYPDGPKDWGEMLGIGLGRELAGKHLEVLRSDSCERAVELDATYCLEAKLHQPTTDYEATVQLLKASGGGLVYSTSEAVDADGGNVSQAAAELGDKVRTFLRVIEDRFFHDPDIQPWFSLQDHDIRAIRDFFLGLAYVYRNEFGGADPMTTAIEIEPEFVAPRVFRTPTLVREKDVQALAEHRGVLDRLYSGATAFEKAMIEWAKALIDNDRADQIQQLRIALGTVQSNRQIEYVLGITLAEAGDLEQAWSHIEPLLGQAWHFPGLYSGAAEIAILRDQIDDIRRALELALEIEPVDPEALGVMTALAVYDGDAESEQRFRELLGRRRLEVAEEEPDSWAVPNVAERLALRAESEGRRAIADRLREFAN